MGLQPGDNEFQQPQLDRLPRRLKRKIESRYGLKPHAGRVARFMNDWINTQVERAFPGGTPGVKVHIPQVVLNEAVDIAWFNRRKMRRDPASGRR